MPADFYIDTKDIKAIKVKLSNIQKQIPGATASALNRTLDHAYTVAGKETTKEYAITIAKAKKTFKKYKASKNSLSAELSSSGSTLTLGSFPHKPETVIIARSLGSKHEKAQVKVKIKKSSKLAGLNISPKAFLQKSNNATNIFAREGKSRFPIKVLRTISIPQMVGQENVVSRIQDEANKKLQERIQHEINWRLDKAARGK